LGVSPYKLGVLAGGGGGGGGGSSGSLSNNTAFVIRIRP
jgi:hypothetical protein